MNFLQKIKIGANKATERAQNAMEINKLNTQISNIEKEMGIYYQRMGQIFYDGYCTKDMRDAETEMLELAKTCDLLNEEKTEIRGKIALLKNERLCECGRVVPEEALYCLYCGRKLERRPVVTAQPEPPKTSSYDEVEAAVTQETMVYPGPLAPHDEDDLTEADVRLTPEEEQRRQLELERERERQLELDRRIQTWKEDVVSPKEGSTATEARPQAHSVKCQICAEPLAKGTRWCPHCGSEQI